MPTIIQTAFNAGEFSPEAWGRVDIAKYFNACKTLKNFICLLHGPATRRPGIEYIADAKYDDTKANLIPFEFSTAQTYMLEFGDEYIRVFTDGGQVVPDAWSSTAIYFTGDQVLEGGVRYTAVAISIGQQPPNVTYWTAESSTAIEIVSPYTDDDVFDLSVVQSADTLFIAHPDYAPRALVRQDNDNWELSSLATSFDRPPFLAQNVDNSTYVEVSAATGAGVDLESPYNIFRPEHVGSYWKLAEIAESNHDSWVTSTAYTAGDRVVYGGNVYEADNSATSGTRAPVHETGTESDGVVDWTYINDGSGYMLITSYVDYSHLVGTVIVELPASVITPNITTRWSEGAWSDYQGWPSTVTFHNERLCWANTLKSPQTLWMSRVGLYYDHSTSTPLADDDALSLILASKQVNAIKWMESMTHLYVGTTKAEWRLTSATGDGPITANSKQAARGSYNGSSGIKPETAGSSLLYVQEQGKILRDLFYDWNVESFIGEDLTLLSEHLTKSETIIQMAFQREPNSVLWCVRSDGKLLGLTYYKEQEVFGWHIHETDGSFESVAVIPGANEDEVWFVVKRTINGSDVRYVERLGEMFTDTDLAEAKFLDSYLTLDNRQDVDSISFTNPGVITLAGHGYSDGDAILFRSRDDDIDGEEDYLSLNYEEFDVAHSTTNTFQLHDPDSNDVDLSEYKQVISATVGKIVTTISGLDHLEGETVNVMADGAESAPKTVSSGSITLSEGSSVTHIGFGYESDLETLNPEIPIRTGATSQKEIKKVESFLLKLYKSLGAQIGPDEDNLKEILFVDDSVLMGRSGDLLTGNTDILSFNGEHRTESNIFIRQSQPYPLTILAIVPEIEV